MTCDEIGDLLTYAHESQWQHRLTSLGFHEVERLARKNIQQLAYYFLSTEIYARALDETLMIFSVHVKGASVGDTETRQLAVPTIRAFKFACVLLAYCSKHTIDWQHVRRIQGSYFEDGYLA